MEESRIDFDLKGIGSLLKDRQLGVPVYQRSYSWQEDQIRDYWSDLKSAFAKSDPEYFLGTVVVTGEGFTDRHSIIDGQQRIATTAMLISAIRDEYFGRGDKERGGAIQQRYIADLDLESGDVLPHLQLNSDDNDFFRSLVVSTEGATTTASKNSHELLNRGYVQLRGYVTSTADDAGSNWQKRLSDWINFVTKNVRVIVVDVPTESDAFLIFETLNDRGADLTIADLLKNYLFGKAGTRVNEVRDGWMQALGALELTVEESGFTSFLRHHWSSKYGATRERELYKSIKSTVTNTSGAVSLVADLQLSARHYSAMQSSDHEFWGQMGTGARNNVETLVRLDLEQHRPLLLAAMQYFGPNDLKKLLRSLVSWSVRGLVVGGIGGGRTEKAYCDAAMKIRSGAVKDTAEVRDLIGEIIASDEEFREAFARCRVTRASLARYYLLTLERCEAGQSEPELVANDDEEKVNLEHVLPKSFRQDDWPDFVDDLGKTYIHRLGNMALLSKGPNDRIGNRPFSVKKPVLHASKLLLTNQAGSENNWTPSVIGSRQERMASLAIAAWPR